jgi:hypothetical protein
METHIKDEQLVKFQELSNGIADSFDQTLKQQLKQILSQTHYQRISTFLDEFESVRVKNKMPE